MIAIIANTVPTLVNAFGVTNVKHQTHKQNQENVRMRRYHVAKNKRHNVILYLWTNRSCNNRPHVGVGQTRPQDVSREDVGLQVYGGGESNHLPP